MGGRILLFAFFAQMSIAGNNFTNIANGAELTPMICLDLKSHGKVMLDEELIKARIPYFSARTWSLSPDTKIKKSVESRISRYRNSINIDVKCSDLGCTIFFRDKNGIDEKRYRDGIECYAIRQKCYNSAGICAATFAIYARSIYTEGEVISTVASELKHVNSGFKHLLTAKSAWDENADVRAPLNGKSHSAIYDIDDSNSLSVTEIRGQ